MGQRQRSLGPPCKKKSTRLGVLRRLLCHSRLQFLWGSESLALPEKYIFVTFSLPEGLFSTIGQVKPVYLGLRYVS